MTTARHMIGIDLGGTNMQVGVVSHDGRALASVKRKTKAGEGFEAVLERMAGAVEAACAESNVDRASIAGVGIGAPGVIGADGVVIEAVNLRWNDVALADELSKRVGVPVYVDNDVNVALYGEFIAGAAKGDTHILGVWIGTGIGGALILDGRLYYGKHNTAGEIGHTILMPNHPPGSRSLEHNCSRTAIVDRLVRLIRSNQPSLLVEFSGGDLDDIRSKAIAEAYKRDDPLTVEVVDSAADLLGIAIANAVTLLSLERVVLGGGLTESLGQPLVKRVKESVRRFVFPDLLRGVKIVASELEEVAGVVGAAMLARDRLSLGGEREGT